MKNVHCLLYDIWSRLLRDSVNIVAYFIYFTSLTVLFFSTEPITQTTCSTVDFSLATLTLFCIPYFASQNCEEVIYNPETASGSILSLLFTCFIFLLVLVTRKGKLRIILHLSPNMTSLINIVFDVLKSVLESGSEVTDGQVVRAGILLT